MVIVLADWDRRVVQASASVVVVVVEACVGIAAAEERQRRMMNLLVLMVLLQGRLDQIDGHSSWRARAAAVAAPDSR